MRVLILALLLLCLAGPTLAAPKTEIFVNNKPFRGASSGPAADLLLEAAPYFKLAGGEFKYDAETGLATLDGSPVEVTVVGEKVFVRAKEMASLVGGRYSVNAALGSVDIYAFDPVEAARKAWARIFSMRAITNEQDFQVMATLTRGILTDAGLDLDFPVELKFSSPQEIVAAGGTAEMRSFTYATVRSSGSGIGHATIYIRSGQAPTPTMSGLGYGWGVFYCRRLGISQPESMLGGVGLWAGYYVLHELGVRMPAERWGTGQDAADRAHFLDLVKIFEAGGAEAVVTSLKNRAPGH